MCVFGLLFLQQDKIKKKHAAVVDHVFRGLFVFFGVSFVVLCGFCCLCFSIIVLFVAQLDVFF